MHSVETYLEKGPLKVLDDIPVAVLFTDCDETILHSNSACREFFGQSNDTILGTRYSDLINASRAESKDRLNDEFLQIGVEIAGQHYNIIVQSRSVGKDLICRVLQDITKALSEVQEVRAEVTKLKKSMAGLLGDSQILPICSMCHKARLADGSWVKPAKQHLLGGNVRMTHGLCPPCTREYLDKNLPEFTE